MSPGAIAANVEDTARSERSRARFGEGMAATRNRPEVGPGERWCLWRCDGPGSGRNVGTGGRFRTAVCGARGSDPGGALEPGWCRCVDGCSGARSGLRNPNRASRCRARVTSFRFARTVTPVRRPTSRAEYPLANSTTAVRSRFVNPASSSIAATAPTSWSSVERAPAIVRSTPVSPLSSSPSGTGASSALGPCARGRRGGEANVGR